MKSLIFKRITTTFFLISLCCSILIAETRVVAAISSIKGDVKIRPGSERKYNSAYKGQMVKNKDWIKTGKNVFVSIIFLDGTNIKIQANTEIEIQSSRITRKELKTQMYIAEGQAWSKVSSQNEGEFKIKTPTAVATVKGTEFDVKFDDLAESTTLTVIEGEVLFGNDIGQVLASAMEGATANKEDPPKEYKVKPKDIPKWHNNTDPTFGFKLTPDKTDKHPINSPLRVSIQAINLKSKQADNTINSEIQISVDNQLLSISKDKSSWSENLNFSIKNGRGTIYVKGGDQGRASMIASSEDGESGKLQFEFFISKKQQIAMGGKLAGIASKKGLSDISNFIAGKSLKSTSIVMGEANIDELLQKVDIGDYEIVDYEPIKNSDGTLKIKLIVQPRGQGEN